MCGIAGIVAPNARSYRDRLGKMIGALRTRGPDDSGIRDFGGCILGHTRLSIVDLETGQQPMLSADSGTGITFNGEIYGYKSIRSGISGYPFRTSSDTEVILALHRKYGAGLLPHLPGMFAFGLWDDRGKELLCARDRFGEKPLFYCYGPRGEFLFASEIKALLASGLVRPVLNRNAVVRYLISLYVHPHETIYGNIHALPPARFLLFRDGQTRLTRYWNPPPETAGLRMEDAVGRFEDLLDRAVARQLVADVEVGAFLSGGLDSSTVVAIARRHVDRIKTFSFGFEDSASELPFARQVAGMYGTEHIELGDEKVDVGELLWHMQEVYDEPFGDSSNIPTYLISKLARRHVKVVLTGDGGDELLGGYSYWYKPLLFMQSRERVHFLQKWLFRHAIRLGNRLGIPGDSWRHRLLGASYSGTFGTIAEAHISQTRYFTDAQVAAIWSGSESPVESLSVPGRYAGGTVDDAMRMDLETYMPGDILVKIDRASMANGLELRAPFLDFEFAEFCISLPYQLKLDRRRDKRILAEAFGKDWPPGFYGRRKQGFGAPVSRWLSRESVRSLKETHLCNPKGKIFSLLSYDRTRAIVRQDDYQTWALLVLALWMDRHDFDLA
jgi:asparagine synthase (glutamine-hydrolysing)